MKFQVSGSRLWQNCKTLFFKDTLVGIIDRYSSINLINLIRFYNVTFYSNKVNKVLIKRMIPCTTKVRKIENKVFFLQIHCSRNSSVSWRIRIIRYNLWNSWTYHATASFNPSLRLYFGLYPNNCFAFSMLASECGISPARFGPWLISTLAISAS